MFTTTSNKEPAWLDINRFKDWLRKFQSHETVGQAGISSRCPFAEYVSEQVHSTVRVGKSIHCLRTNAQLADSPEWLQQFNAQLDASCECYVSAEQCLEILSSLGL